MGFTLVEFAVAIALSILIMGGAAAILRYTVVQTGANTDRTIAQLQAQYVNFWISQDVVQAGNITLGNSSSGFPLTMTRTGLDGGNSTVTYDVVNNTNLSKNPWQLTRTEVNGQGNVTSLVAEYVVPWGGSWLTGISYNVNDRVSDNGSSYVCIAAHTSSSSNEPGAGASWTTYWKVQQGTKACQGNTTYNVLMLEVAAQVDQGEADRKYQISPRLGNATIWENPYPCYCAETEQGAGSGQ